MLDLNKQVKATVVAGGNHSLTVSIGTGQPLVVGGKAFQLAAMPSPGDPSRMRSRLRHRQEGHRLADSSLTGGELGGLLEFRFDHARQRAKFARPHRHRRWPRPSTPRTGWARTARGNMGGDLFARPRRVGVNPTSFAAGRHARRAAVDATMGDPSKLTTSDYKVGYDAVDVASTRSRACPTERDDDRAAAYTPAGAADR